MSSPSQIIAGRNLTISYGEINLKLYVDMRVGIGGDKWPAAELFCSFVSNTVTSKKLFRNQFSGKKILELGSGNGMVAIVMEKSFDLKALIVSDIEQHVDLIHKNLHENNLMVAKAAVIDWRERENSLINDQFDVIIALECVYREDLYVPLILTILQYSHAHTVTYLGLTKQFMTPSFFESLSSHGLQYRMIPHAVIKSCAAVQDAVDENIGLFLVFRTEIKFEPCHV